MWLFFEVLSFPYFLDKSKFGLIFKINFLIKVSKKLQNKFLILVSSIKKKSLLFPQETQQKKFKVVKSPKGEINFRPPPR